MHTSRHAHTETDRSPWIVLALLAVAQFMVILDVTVVNVALPSIGESLDFSPGDLQWVVTAYVLFTGGLMLLGGRLGDLLGARRVFGVGLGLFTGASLLSGLSWSPEVLVGLVPPRASALPCCSRPRLRSSRPPTRVISAPSPSACGAPSGARAWRSAFCWAA